MLLPYLYLDLKLTKSDLLIEHAKKTYYSLNHSVPQKYMSYIHHVFDFIIFPFYAQYYQRFIYIFSKIYNSHLVIIYISDNSFSKKGNEISPTPFVISYLFTIPLHLHPLIPPRHWLSLFLCNLTAVFIQTQKDRFPLLWYFWILLFR